MFQPPLTLTSVYTVRMKGDSRLGIRRVREQLEARCVVSGLCSSSRRMVALGNDSGLCVSYVCVMLCPLENRFDES